MVGGSHFHIFRAIRFFCREFDPDPTLWQLIKHRAAFATAKPVCGVVTEQRKQTDRPWRRDMPVKAIKVWLAASGISDGPRFCPVAKGWPALRPGLTYKSVCDQVKAYAGRVGLDPAAFGAYSLRAGFLTSAARRGASVFKMRDVSRHKSMDVLQAYVRDADLFRDHAGAGLL